MHDDDRAGVTAFLARWWWPKNMPTRSHTGPAGIRYWRYLDADEFLSDDELIASLPHSSGSPWITIAVRSASTSSSGLPSRLIVNPANAAIVGLRVPWPPLWIEGHAVYPGDLSDCLVWASAPPTCVDALGHVLAKMVVLAGWVGYLDVIQENAMEAFRQFHIQAAIHKARTASKQAPQDVPGAQPIWIMVDHQWSLTEAHVTNDFALIVAEQVTDMLVAALEKCHELNLDEATAKTGIITVRMEIKFDPARTGGS